MRTTVYLVVYVLLLMVAWKSKDWYISTVLDGNRQQWIQRTKGE